MQRRCEICGRIGLAVGVNTCHCALVGVRRLPNCFAEDRGEIAGVFASSAGDLKDRTRSWQERLQNLEQRITVAGGRGGVAAIIFGHGRFIGFVSGGGKPSAEISCEAIASAVACLYLTVCGWCIVWIIHAIREGFVTGDEKFAGLAEPANSECEGEN